MKMKPTFRTTLLFIALSAFITTNAFASGQQEPADQTEKGASVSFAFWGGQEEYDLTDQLKELFHQENPEIDIQLQQVESNQYEQKLLIQFAAGTAPDAMVIRDASSQFLARRGLFADLTPYIEGAGTDMSLFDPAALKAYQLEGAQYGLPREMTPVVLYFNKAMFDRAGLSYPDETWTWEDFTRAAQTLTQDLDGDGENDQWGTFMVPWDALFLPIIYSFGGNLLNEDGSASNLLNDKTVAAFRYADGLINDLNAAPPVSIANSFGWIDGFAQEKYAMIFQGRWATPIFLDAIEKTEQGFEFDVAPVPAGELRRSVNYSSALGILKTSENREAAFSWLQFLTSDEGQSIYGGERSLVVAANRNVAKTVAAPGALPENAMLFLSEIKNGTAPPQTPSFSGFYEILNRHLNEVFLQLKPLEQGLADADREINDFLKESYESLK